MGTLIIQVAARSERSPQITKCAAGSLSVGRAFSNDIVLADPFVAPRQLRFDVTEQGWNIAILDQTNPVFVNGEAILTTGTAVHPGDRITVGRTHVRLFSEDHPVEPTRKLLLSSWITPGRVGPVLAFATLLALATFDGVTDFFQSSVDLDWEDYGYGALFYVAAIVLWAGIWSIVGRVLRHQPQFLVQLLATSLITGLATLSYPLAGYLEFFTSSVTVGEAANYLIAVAILTGLLKLNLFFATNIRDTWRAALVASCVLFALVFASNQYEEEDFEAEPVYSRVVKPPFAHVRSDQSIENLLDAVSNIRLD